MMLKIFKLYLIFWKQFILNIIKGFLENKFFQLVNDFFLSNAFNYFDIQ